LKKTLKQIANGWLAEFAIKLAKLNLHAAAQFNSTRYRKKKKRVNVCVYLSPNRRTIHQEARGRFHNPSLKEVL